MYIDLSVVLNDQTPTYPGDPATKIEPAGVIDQDGYNDHYVSIGTHVGTHMDAPLHMIKGGKNLSQMPIEQFIGRGRYIKVVNQTFSLEAVEQAAIQAGDIVLFDTGMSRQFHEPAYFDSYPAIPEDIARYLARKRVKIVGMDMCSPDHEPYPIHRLLLAKNVLIIENLTNLDQLAGQEFTIFALPLKLEIDAAPTRVIAKIND